MINETVKNYLSQPRECEMTYYTKKGQVIRNPRAYFRAVREDRYGYNKSGSYSSSSYKRKRY